MSVTKARVSVADDHSICGIAPDNVPPGEHEVAFTDAPAASAPKRRFSVKDMPVHDTPWDDSISLRREDMYGDDGR